MKIAPLVAALDWLIPPDSHEDPDLRRRARLLGATSFAFTLISAYFSAQMTLVEKYPPLSLYVMFLGVVFGLLDLVLMRYIRSVQLVGFVLCVQVLIIVGFQAASDQGLGDPTLLWNIVLPWLAAFLVGPIWGLVIAGLVVVETIVLYVLELTNFPFPNYSGPEEVWLFYVTTASSVALFIGFLGWMYEGQTLKTLRETNQKLARARDDLQASQTQIQSVLESITDGFFALDPDLRFTYVNHRAEELLSRSRKDLLGQLSLGHVRTYFGPEVTAHLEDAMRHGEPMETEVFCTPVERWFEVHIFPFAGGISAYFSDITARKEYEEGLIEARDKAEDLARLRSTFLTNISHEIRTPLTGILGFASLLAKETTGVHQEFSELIEANGQRLLETLNSVLNLAKLESGTMQPEATRVNVVEEAERTVQLLGSLARDKQLSLNIECNTDNAVIHTDAGYLRQILNNLVGNAIKFCDNGGVTILIGGNAEQLVLKISDTGIGISSTFLPYLFEEFRQESNGLNRSHQGTGLGLAITRRLVAAIGGTIEVESTKGVGTTFTIQIDRHPVREEVTVVEENISFRSN